MILIADKIIARTDQAPLEDHALLVRKGFIEDIGHQSRIMRSRGRNRIFRFPNSVLLPGLVNVHAHLELPALMGSRRRSDYVSWVGRLLKAKAGLNVQDYRTAARTNIRNIIRSGTTTIADISTHNVSPGVLSKSGLRAVVYHEIIAMKPRDLPSIPPLHSTTALVRHGISPHSPHTVSERALVILHRYAREHMLPLCMHVAETRDELLLLQRKKNRLQNLYAAACWDQEWAPRAASSFQYLDRLGMLDPRFLAVHAVHAGPADVRLIARSGAAVAHCPRSNHALRTGTMPLKAMLAAGIHVGLGTDSLASVPSLNLWDEMRFALRTHKADGMTAKDIVHLATLGGAQALGLDGEIGSLEVGKRADIIVVPKPRRMTGDICVDLLRETHACTRTMVNGTYLS